MNIRHAYDKVLEEIIDSNEYRLDPDEQPFRPSYLDYNYPNMKPVFLQHLTGYDRTIAEYHQHCRQKIKALEEDECRELLRRTIFPDIYKIKTSDDDYDRIDWHVPSVNFYIEHKKRNRPYFDRGLTIDKDKYDRLMEEEHAYYINSSSIGLFIWNLKLVGECEWEWTEKSPRGNSGLKKHQLESNWITYLPYEKCNDLTYLLLI